MTYGYIRVSSDKQTVENQRFEIENFCRRNSIYIDGWIEETISGTKDFEKKVRRSAEPTPFAVMLNDLPSLSC